MVSSKLKAVCYRTTTLELLFLAASLVATSSNTLFLVNAQPLLPDGVFEDVLVKFNNPSGKTAAQAVGVQNNCPDLPDKYGFTCARIPTSAKAALEENPNIDAVTSDMVVHALGWRTGEVPVSSLQQQQQSLRGRSAEDAAGGSGRDLQNGGESLLWGIEKVQAPQVSQATPVGNKKTKVCVVDTGYGLGHPDLPVEYSNGGWVEGIDTTTSLPWTVDVNGHGSHCSGTIGEVGGNDLAYYGVNPTGDSFGLIICRGMNDSGSGTLSTIMTAISNCISFKDDDTNIVISMSFGISTDQGVSSFYNQIYENGTLLVAAAGNEGAGANGFPAQYNSVISVAASDVNDRIASFSTTNSQVELTAPGVNIMSTTTSRRGKNFDYSIYSGTSMACPHVAGVAALVWSHFPQCTNKEIRQAMIQTARSIQQGETCNNEQGHGIVQAKAMYDLLSTSTPGTCDAVLEGPGLGGCNEKVDIPMPPTASPAPSESSSPSSAPALPQSQCLPASQITCNNDPNDPDCCDTKRYRGCPGGAQDLCVAYWSG